MYLFEGDNHSHAIMKYGRLKMTPILLHDSIIDIITKYCRVSPKYAIGLL